MTLPSTRTSAYYTGTPVFPSRTNPLIFPVRESARAVETTVSMSIGSSAERKICFIRFNISGDGFLFFMTARILPRQSEKSNPPGTRAGHFPGFYQITVPICAVLFLQRSAGSKFCPAGDAGDRHRIRAGYRQQILSRGGCRLPRVKLSIRLTILHVVRMGSSDTPGRPGRHPPYRGINDRLPPVVE